MAWSDGLGKSCIGIDATDLEHLSLHWAPDLENARVSVQNLHVHGVPKLENLSFHGAPDLENLSVDVYGTRDFDIICLCMGCWIWKICLCMGCQTYKSVSVHKVSDLEGLEVPDF